MHKKQTSTPIRYGLPAAFVALLLLLSYALEQWFSINFDPTSLIIVAMIASAWYFGLGPGLLVAILFEAVLDYFSGATFTYKSGIVLFNRLVLFGSVVLFASSRRNAEGKLVQQRDWNQPSVSSTCL
jgi:hypothetical protein